MLQALVPGTTPFHGRSQQRSGYSRTTTILYHRKQRAKVRKCL